MLVKVRVVFGQGRPKLEDGILAIHTSEKPEKGMANRDVVSQVARFYGVPASHVRIRSGLKSRNKLLELVGVEDVPPD